MSRRIDLAVPFEEKEEAKQFFVEWDEVRRVWWTTEEFMCEGLERWLPFEPTLDEVLATLPPLSSTEAERLNVELLAQTCEFREWLLLMLPGGLWGGFLRADLENRAASAVVEGDYGRGCRYVSSTPTETLAFMREHRIYQGELSAKEDRWQPPQNHQGDLDGTNSLHCTGHLTIGEHTIEVQLPLRCANLIAHLAENAPVPDKYSPLSLAVSEYLDRHTPNSVKYPLSNQLELTREISQKLRIPISSSHVENRSVCLAFIDQHKADLTLYRLIFAEQDRGSRPLAKRINNYVKWSTARALLDGGVPWGTIAESLGVKTRATVEKYAMKAVEAEEEMPELLTVPLYQDLIKLGRSGRNVDLALREMAEAQAWEIFSRERAVRTVLRNRSAVETTACKT